MTEQDLLGAENVLRADTDKVKTEAGKVAASVNADVAKAEAVAKSDLAFAQSHPWVLFTMGVVLGFVVRALIG